VSSRRKMSAYWLLIRSGSALIRRAILHEIARRAAVDKPLEGARSVDGAARLERVDHSDTSYVTLPRGRDHEAVDFATAVLSTPPIWIRVALAIRDAVVSRVGIASAPANLFSRDEVRLDVGQAVGPFRVYAVSDDEVILGNDDDRLGLRTSFRVIESEGHHRGACTTTVMFRHPIGRWYFRLIQPFHNLLIPHLLRRSVTAQQHA
jgi:Protein of unknown function (DUF2867)